MTAGIYEVDEAFRLAEALELDFVELTYDVCDFLPNAQPAKRVQALSRATGVEVSVHLPFVDLNIASLIETVRRATVEQTCRALEYSARVGAQCAVLHTGTRFIYQPRPVGDAIAALYQSLSELPDTPTPVALENLGLYVDGVVREPTALREVTRHMNLHNCLDFGHAHIEGGGASACHDFISAYISTLGQDIIHLHLCNNDGLSDLHTATPDGTVAYERYAAYLQDFPGTICLEVAGGPDSVRRSAEHIRSLRAL